MNYEEQLIKALVEPYQRANPNGEFSKQDVAAWAIHHGLWKPSMKSMVALLSDELSHAMQAQRREYKGRKIREYHCIERTLDDGYKQLVWAHIDVATPEFMEQSVARRRHSLASKAYQLHCDILYWNEQKNNGAPLEVLFDFRDDNADRDHELNSGDDSLDN